MAASSVAISPRPHMYDPPVPLRVVFAEDNYLVREGTAALLSGAEDVELVAAVSDLPSLLEAVEEKKPGAVLTDIRMPPNHGTEGIEAARRIRSEHPDIGVVVLSQFAEEDYAYELLKDGAAGLGYLLKERVADVDELVRALHEVSKGGSVLDPKVVEGLINRKERLARSPLAQLTDREREVLALVAEGKTNKEIGQALVLSEKTVKNYLSNIMEKLQVTRRSQAAAYFVQHSFK